MSEWRDASLANAPLEILDGDRGKNYPTQVELHSSGHCLFLSAKNVRADGFDFSDCQFITQEKDQVLRKGKLARYDTVLTTRGTVGNVAYYNDKVPYDHIRINSGMVIIRPHVEQLIPSYCYWMIRMLQVDFQVFASGSAQPQLPIRDLKQIEVCIPPFQEQRAISDVLSSLNDKIDLLHRQNKTLEAMAETLFRQWFVEEASDDWKEVKLDCVCKINPRSVGNDYPYDEIQYLDTGALTDGQFGQTEPYHLSEAPSRARRLVEHNDVLISTVRPNQRHYGIVKCPPDNLVVSTGFCVVHAAAIDPHFIYLFLTRPDMTEYLHSVAEGSTSTYPSLKPSDIGSLTIRMPPKEALHAFSEYARNAWTKIARNDAQVRTLERIRDTLLPRLMTGEVRIA